MSVKHRRRGLHAEAIAPWVALSFILLMWWMGAQALHWYRPAHRYPLWSFDPSPVAESKKVSKPIDAPAPSAAAMARPGEAAMSAADTGISHGDVGELRSRGLMIPVEGIPAGALVSSFSDARAGHKHEAIDILAPRDTKVLAVENGTVAKLFTSDAGGLTIYQFDPSQRFVYYYAHLDSYASGLKEGDSLKRGDVIGYVGTTGNAPKNTPHLHFGISKLDADHRWWGGTALDPYLVWRESSTN
jgi:murein DD-endopeptidase MepM/ murein hydrolase activator NlpD